MTEITVFESLTPSEDTHYRGFIQLHKEFFGDKYTEEMEQELSKKINPVHCCPVRSIA
jgi:hypothetical protein